MFDVAKYFSLANKFENDAFALILKEQINEKDKLEKLNSVEEFNW